MNILILSWRGSGHPNEGGAEIATHEYAKAWVNVGHSVTLFTSSYSDCKGREFIDGVEIIRQGSQTFGVHLRAFIWYIFGKHKKYDLVIDHFHGIPFFTPLYVKTKKMAMIHEVAKEVWQYNQYQFPRNLFVASIGFRIEPHIFKLYKNIHFMTISKSTKKDLINWEIPEKNITIIYNGVNKPKKQTYKKEKEITITFLGALAKDKGIETAIDVFSHLQISSDINFQFWIIGKGDSNYLRFLKKRIEKLNLRNVKFWGYVSEDRKFILLGRSHILINPSIREGWGLVVIEAAEVGTPTVAFNVPGLRDSIIDNKTGLLSQEYSAKGLADSIFELLENRKRYSLMCENAVSWGNRFSWEKATKESLKLLDKIMS
ncbi:glycosyltransferase family 4 protein [Candidatus Daviesbacteria bacterium]|nr:glycosyltransferase family 4 protein [Candidatus Daviesbacteria bacterium]